MTFPTEILAYVPGRDEPALITCDPEFAALGRTVVIDDVEHVVARIRYRFDPSWTVCFDAAADLLPIAEAAFD